MMHEKHLIIGANGPIGMALYDGLKKMGKEVIRFGRSNKHEVDYIKGDALNQTDIKSAVKGITHIYITIGLKYHHRIWQKEWPLIIDNIINAAKETKAKLIFFDNIYIYGPTLSVPITEEHEINPVSKKGKVRKTLYLKLLEAQNKLDVLIVRAPDFFGPGAQASMIHSAFLENMIKGKIPLFLGKKDKKHAYGYTKDLAKATIKLAFDEDTYNQVWHLPCYQTETIYQILSAYNHALQKTYNLRVIGKKAHYLLALMIPLLRELYEMRYQFESDYVLNFDKFMRKYPDFVQTSFEEAIKETVQFFVKNNT